ncbi:TPA: restriction endonuclease subunit S [Aeromonas veronii]|uniref:restriction endonuclease subunit S n=1 Tax=Aeromonas TaxID=642 RepID=UPI003D25394C
MAALKIENLITDHLDLWTAAVRPKSSTGRGSNSKLELIGIKKLRELILELSVRGKLVPQDPNDEPASVLLERIAAEKTRLVKEGKIKKPKALPEISEEEKRFELPEGWAELRLGAAINVLNGRAYKKHEMLESGTPLLRVGNLFTSDKWYYSDLELEPEKYIDNGDLIYSWSASFGPFIWNGGRVIYHYHIWKMDIFDPDSLDKHFMCLYLDAISASIKASGNGIAMVHMTKEKMEQLVIPIPPISEQHRIVAKVDELMALCDQLEQHSESQLAAHQTLVETLLATLTDSCDADELAQNWARLSTHFDTLFTTEASIDALKQTILQLAVMGKLVPQDPSDEPTSALLERIAAEKARLVKEKRIKKEKLLPAISEDEKPFELPQGWEWCHLKDIITIMDAGWSPACPPESSPDIDTWGVLKTTAVQTLEYREYENKVLDKTKTPRPEYEVMVGDILITRAGPKNRVGISCLVEKTRPKLMISDKIIRFHLVEVGLSERFISLCLNAGATAVYIDDSKSGMAESQMNISQDKLKLAPIPLGPIKEQNHIMDRVDQLMTLCDQLKSRLQTNQQTQLKLVDSLVEQAF